MITQNTLNTKSYENPYYIKFYPKLKLSIGSEKAALILGRLEYWFQNNKYVNGFYKFIEPCNHPLYREGDSWAEEIGFSRKIFSKSFDLIGVRYKSKSAFLKSSDRFQGKPYASYHNRKTNQTYFVRNNECASELIKNLFKRKNPSTPILSKNSSLEKNISENKTPSIKPSSSQKNGRYRNGQNRRSSGGTIGGKENKLIQRNTSSIETCDSKKSHSILKQEEKR